MTSAVRLDGVTKVYGHAETRVKALDGVTLELPHASFTAIMGPSGSGKSTLLQCAAGLEPIDGGSVALGGESIAGWSDAKLTRFRRSRVGFVFQSYSLLPYLTAQENVSLPLRLARGRINHRKVRDMLALVGLADRADHRPDQLSGGQQQRVAIARALVTEPAVLFADEPTGALDTRSARDVLGLLRRAVDELGQSVVMVTHDPSAAAWADEVLFLVDGRITVRLSNPSADEVAARLARLGDIAAAGSVTAGAAR